VNNLSILLKNACVITMNESSETKENCCVGIRYGKIDYVGPYTDELEDKYDKVMDCKGKIVMPGFFNTHGHAAMTLFRNYADDLSLMEWLFKKVCPLEDNMDGEAVYWGTQLAVLEMIKSGTVAFTDMYFFMDSAARAVEESGMKALLSRGLQGSDASKTDLRILENLELHDKYHNSCGGRIRVGLGPHSVYTASFDYLKCVAEVARERNIAVQVHASENDSELQGCMDKYGMSPVKLLDKAGLLTPSTIAAHCVRVDEDDMEILKARGVSVAHNPSSNMKLASGIAPVKRMVDKGINVSLGTDGAASNNCLDMFKEMREASYLQKVATLDPTALPVDTVLKMATINGAKAMGFNNSGVIMEGAAADIIIINADREYYHPRHNMKSALVYSCNSTDVEASIIDGRLVMENGKVKTLDEDLIYREVEKSFQKLTH
jgi:5-methylthioadenosine/S-adenosylhomocysteine deaminase